MKLGLLSALSLLVCLPSGAAAEPEMRAEMVGEAEPCSPVVTLSGDPTLLQELSDELQTLGVSTEAEGDCPTARASIDSVSAGLFVSLTESSGRHAYRNVSDLRIAATWIDSRLREELGANLLSARTVAPQFRDKVPEVTAADERVVSSPVPAAIEPSTSAPRRGWLAGLSYESASAGENEDWQALRAGVCATLSFACVGVGVRVAQLQNDLVSSDGLSRFHQQAVDGFAQAQLPIAIGRSVLSPHIAIGMGMLRSQRRPSEECLEFIDDSGECAVFFLDDQPSSRISWSPRVEAGLSLAVPLSSAIELQLGASVDLRPVGESSRGVEDPGFPEPPVCEDPNDPDCVDIQPEPFELQTLPEDPTQFIRLSLGLQVRL